MVGAIVFVLILVVVAVVAYVTWRNKQRRRESLAMFAMQNGMQFSQADPYDIPDAYGFRLFGLGDGRGCENVLTGAWQGLPVREADYWYYTESTDSKGNRTKSYHYFSVVVADMACSVPHVIVQKETLFSKLADHLGFHDIDFESEQFNREFQVKTQDREFAYKLVDARMIQWLLSMGGPFGFEVNGPNLLVWSGRRGPGDLIPLFGSARMFCDHIPRLVWNDYGTGPSRPDGGSAGPSPEERSAT